MFAVTMVFANFDDSEWYLVMEYFQDGSLLDAVKRQHFSIQTKIRFCLEIAHGMWHLHDNEVIHGDIALRNILVDIHHGK
eukprot:UN07034